MSELEDKINSILGDPQQMEKITNMARSLMGGGGAESAPEGEGKAEPDVLGGLGIDPASLQRLGRLLSRGEARSPRSGHCWRP